MLGRLGQFDGVVGNAIMLPLCAVQMKTLVKVKMARWSGKKTMSDKVSWGEFFQVVITGEYSVSYCWPFSGTDAIRVRYSYRSRYRYDISIFRWVDPSLEVFAIAELPVNNVCLHYLIVEIGDYVISVCRKKLKSGRLTVSRCLTQHVRWTYRVETLRMTTSYCSVWEVARMATYSRSGISVHWQKTLAWIRIE